MAQNYWVNFARNGDLNGKGLPFGHLTIRAKMSSLIFIPMAQLGRFQILGKHILA
jgi:hypothetical protein